MGKWYLSSILSIAAIAIATASFTISYQQYQHDLELNSMPNIVACLRSLSYEKGQTFPNGGSPNYQPIGVISFDLVNKGTTSATVNRVDVVPIGTMTSGGQGWMTFTIDIDATVTGNGITKIMNKNFSNPTYIQGIGWINKPNYLYMTAYWPNGNGQMLECIPDAVSLTDKWFCGPPVAPSASLAEENACR